MTRSLHDSWSLGGVTIPNRLVLAPLAGIGNWFVRLQAKRYGAGLAVSEMVSSFGIHYGNEKTVVEMLRIHPDERAGGRGRARRARGQRAAGDGQAALGPAPGGDRRLRARPPARRGRRRERDRLP